METFLSGLTWKGSVRIGYGIEKNNLQSLTCPYFVTMICILHVINKHWPISFCMCPWRFWFWLLPETGSGLKWTSNLFQIDLSIFLCLTVNLDNLLQKLPRLQTCPVNSSQSLNSVQPRCACFGASPITFSPVKCVLWLRHTLKLSRFLAVVQQSCSSRNVHRHHT